MATQLALMQPTTLHPRTAGDDENIFRRDFFFTDEPVERLCQRLLLVVTGKLGARLALLRRDELHRTALRSQADRIIQPGVEALHQREDAPGVAAVDGQRLVAFATSQRWTPIVVEAVFALCRIVEGV